MPLQITQRHLESVWRWPWRREPARSSCTGLLQNLPLRLLRQPGSDAALLELLDALRGELGAGRVCLLLGAGVAGQRRCLGDRRLLDCPGHAQLPAPGSLQGCRACGEAGCQRLLYGLPGAQGPSCLLLEFPSAPGSRTRARLRQVGRQLGEVLAAFAEDRRLRQCELAAERGVLARELHDSVAQQLSYLQIRVSRLETVLGSSADEAAQSMLDDLRETLALLHRQVRELISSARLTMDGRSLRQALEASVEEFARRSSCVFSLDNRLPAERIAAQAELQVLQIVREALANVVRHSHARNVRVALLATAEGFRVLVEDDGVGLPQEQVEEGHFGLRIMAERAAAIGASLRIEARQPQGTRVELCWAEP